MTGLHQNWMRDYDPTLGRYIQADPLGLVEGASVYNYARQNPARYTDVTGLCPFCPAIIPIITGGGGGATGGGILSAGASGIGVAIGAIVFGSSPSTMQDGTVGGNAQSDIGSGSGSCTANDNECEHNRDQCYMRRIADRDGAVFGESRCQQCYRQCKRDGFWPSKVSGTRKSCNWTKSPRSKLWSLLP